MIRSVERARETERKESHMKDQFELKEIRLHNIIDMGLTFSAMIRLFEKGSKKKLRKQILAEAKNVFEAKSEEDFNNIHSNFCNWGVKNILLAKKGTPASYGQIAKTFDVVLKVTVYYSHLPNCEKSAEISEWLNAAVDTKMMDMLKDCYPKDIQPWPTTVEKVDKTTYVRLQKIVRKFIREKHNRSLLPVQFDDFYWKALNR